MFDSEDSILKWFSLFISNESRTVHHELSSNVVFYCKSKKRTIIIEMTSYEARDVTCGSDVSMDNLIGLSYDFWPSKPSSLITIAPHEC